MQSFPESVLAGFKVEAEDPGSDGKPGAVLVDATEFFVRDAHGVTETLSELKQGAYKVDAARSAIAMDGTKAFPKNTEVEAVLTFVTDAARPGEYVRDVAPDPHALTMREHQSFIELPGPGFTPRRFDPRAGYFPTGYRDYSGSAGRAAGPTIHLAAPADQEGSEVPDRVRRGAADPVLRRSRGAGADPLGAGRRRSLVG